MNAQCYRVIFNKARGMLMVVSEAARSQGKTSNPSEGGSSISQIAAGSQTTTHTNGYYQGGQLNSLRSHLLLALGMATIISTSVSTNAHADSTKIVADRNAAAAQQAAILKASNGKTQVNIQTPSVAGVSRNVFSQFDVGSDGAILNNSRTNAQTQIAGWVEGNPYLARGEARVILNEVNSSDPSRLGGYTEIAGGKAELIIANPAGISCAGCGFINASRTTLTTGQALMDQGRLTGFDVTGGKVRIDGDGLDTSSSDYTQIIAKTAEINAGIYAKNLDVITGSNKISYESDAADTIVTSNDATNSTNQAMGVALDVSSLGAMYAGKIRLIGTEKGMGVTNAGSITASSGGLQLDSNGNLINSGSLVANQDKVDINTKGFSIDNSGTIASSRDAAALKSSTLNNSGVISSRGTLSLQQTGNIDNSGEIATGSFDIQSAALKNSGKLLQTGTGNLSITAQQLINQQGAVIGQDLYADNTSSPTDPTTTPPSTAINGSSIESSTEGSSQSTVTPEPLPIITQNGRIDTGDLTNTGSIYTNGDINVSADSVANQDKSSLAVSTLDITDDGSVSNTDSRLQLESIDWQLADFDNTAGQVITNAGINISTNSDIDNTKGTLASNGDITLNANGDINNNLGVIQSSAKLTTDSDHINNSNGKLISQEELTINSRGDLTNTKGAINSAKDAAITSKSLDNDSGQITAQGSLTTRSDSVNNSGQLYGKTETQLTAADTINNSGTIASGGNVDMTTGSLTQTDSGSLVAGMSADGTLLNNSANLNVLASGDITSQGNHIATGDVSLSGGDINLLDSNTQGSSINTTARTSINTTNASIRATDTLTLSSTNGTLDNTSGVLSGRVLEIDAKRLNNTDGKLTQTEKQDLTLALAEGIDNTRGEIASNSDNLTLSTTTLDNSSGKIIHAGTSSNDDSRLSINADSVNNNAGEILSLGEQTWQIAKDIDNTSGVVQANRFTISAQNFDNIDGRIVAVNTQTAAKNTASSNSQLQIQENFTNAGTGIVASDTGSLTVTASDIDNNEGQISSVNDLSLKTRTLTNSGSLYSQADVDIVNQGAMNNTGSIAAQGDTTVNTGSLVQSADGQLIAGLNTDNTLSNTPSTLRVTSTGTQRNAGTNIATGDIYLQGSSLDLSDGSSQGISIDMQADDALINTNGVINGDNITLTSKQIDNSTGLIVAAEGLALNTELLNNQAGDIRHLGASPLTLAIADINNQSGYLGSNAQTLTINSERLNNSKGVIQHSGSGALNISATEQLQGQEGQLITGNILTLSGQDIDLSGASTQAGSIQLTAQTLSNQDGEIILTDKAHESLIDVQQQLNNIDGRIASQNKQLIIDTGSMDNQGGQIQFVGNDTASSQFTLTSRGLINNQTGEIIANTDSLISADGDINNQQGKINSNGALNLQSSGTLSNLGVSSEIISQGDLTISANSINNDQNIQSNALATISSQAQLDNRGSISSIGTLNLDSGSLDNSGSLYSQADVDIVNQGAMNNTGSIAAQGDTT
ncbi:filamentous hemagglutinin N-terminal domain-containing protein, partial [Psychrobacter sp. NPDC078409]|uniref:two-partner secretion domain-containing protein n=1 Tax=Psychrobacter sp. NPDC078409 TaxID=3390660 RepID=UPI003D086874